MILPDTQPIPVRTGAPEDADAAPEVMAALSRDDVATQPFAILGDAGPRDAGGPDGTYGDGEYAGDGTSIDGGYDTDTDGDGEYAEATYREATYAEGTYGQGTYGEAPYAKATYGDGEYATDGLIDDEAGDAGVYVDGSPQAWWDAGEPPESAPAPLPTAWSDGRSGGRSDGNGPPPGPPSPPPAPTAPPAPPQPSVLDSRWAQDSLVTRLLCATAHLHGEYAEAVIGALLDPSFTAIAPSWGLDPTALAQHAQVAQTRRRERDRSLRYCLAGMVVIPLMVVTLALAGGLAPFSVALSVVVVTVAGFVVAWMIVFAHYEMIRISVLEVMDTRRNPRDTAPDLPPGTRKRLEELAEANTVVFGGYQPFVGCGVTLDSWTLCIDLAPDRSGAVVAFDPLDLHDHLLRTIPSQTPGGLWAAPRLFVAGNGAKAIPGLVPDPYEPDTWPANRLPDEVLRTFTRKPTETARTYVCLAHPAWKGEIVVSMLVRAELAGSKLFVEGRTHALLPPRASFREYKYVPKHPRRAWIAVARATGAVIAPLLFGCYTRKLELMKGTRRFLRNRQRMRKELAQGHPFNYGATGSLREEAADPGELKYYAAVDEVRSFRMLKRQILTEIEAFLADRGVDVADFRRQAEDSLVETTVHLHDLAASGDGFGPKNTVTVRDMSPSPG